MGKKHPSKEMEWQQKAYMRELQEYSLSLSHYLTIQFALITRGRARCPVHLHRVWPLCFQSGECIYTASGTAVHSN